MTVTVRFEPDWQSPLGVRDLVDYVDSYERLGGPLPVDLAEHVESLRDEWARRYNAGSRAGTRRSAKIGRNEPCPCASGKKYKKCCLGKPLPTSTPARN